MSGYWFLYIGLLLLGFFCFVLFVLVFRDRLFPCSPGTHSVDQAGFELRNPPASASQVLELKACATTARLPSNFLRAAEMSTVEEVTQVLEALHGILSVLRT